MTKDQLSRWLVGALVFAAFLYLIDTLSRLW